MRKTLEFLLILLILLIISALVIGTLAAITLAIKYNIFGWTFTVLIGFFITCFFINRRVKKLISWKLEKFNFKPYLSKTLLGLYSTSSNLFILAFTLIFAFMFILTNSQKTYSSPHHCKAESLSEIKECQGYGVLGWQNDSDYDIRAYGSANKELCNKYKQADFSNSFIKNMNTTDDIEQVFKTFKNDHSCDINKPEKSWIPVKCSFAEYPELTNCYACARGLSNGNGHRFGLVTYSEDCKTGAYVFLAQWQTVLIEKIRTLIPLDNQEEPPEILIENTNK